MERYGATNALQYQSIMKYLNIIKSEYLFYGSLQFCMEKYGATTTNALQYQSIMKYFNIKKSAYLSYSSILFCTEKYGATNV